MANQLENPSPSPLKFHWASFELLGLEPVISAARREAIEARER